MLLFHHSMDEFWTTNEGSIKLSIIKHRAIQVPLSNATWWLKWNIRVIVSSYIMTHKLKFDVLWSNSILNV